MKDLIAFLRKLRIFILFVVLQGIAIFLYIDNYFYPKTSFFSSTNIVSSYVMEKTNWIYQFFNAPLANTELQRENSALRKELNDLKMAVDSTHFKDTTIDSSAFEYIPATVIYSTYGNRNNYITIDRGSNDGIEEGMGVFTNQSIVGVVHHVTTHYSVIKSVLSAKIYIDVKIADNNNAFGLLNWDGKSPRTGTIDGISSDIPIKRWSKVVTRGSGGIFPPGMYVGKIRYVRTNNEKPMWNLGVWYQEDFRRLSKVYVIKNLRKNEFKEIEKIVIKEEKRAR